LKKLTEIFCQRVSITLGQRPNLRYCLSEFDLFMMSLAISSPYWFVGSAADVAEGEYSIQQTPHTTDLCCEPLITDSVMRDGLDCHFTSFRLNSQEVSLGQRILCTEVLWPMACYCGYAF